MMASKLEYLDNDEKLDQEYYLDQFLVDGWTFWMVDCPHDSEWIIDGGIITCQYCGWKRYRDPPGDWAHPLWYSSPWFTIIDLTNQHGYMSGVDRMSERVKATGEVFTPTPLVIELLQSMPIEQFAPGKTVIDPACGDGQLLVPVKWLKVLHFGMTEADAVKDLYGVDIMRDNVDLCRQRLGGGNIVMGNSLEPLTRLDGQTDEEYRLVNEWLGESSLVGLWG